MSIHYKEKFVWKIDDGELLMRIIWKHINQEFIAKQFSFDNTL